MEKEYLKYIVDVLMGISFLIVSLTGIFKLRVLRDYFAWIFEIIPGKQMAMVHDWSGIFLILLVIVHLKLNWSWIVGMTKNILQKGKKEGEGK